MLVSLIPNAEQCLFASTGSDAVAAALRIARALTGRSKIIKMEGSYHGSAAAFFVNVLFPRPLYPRLAVLGESLASGL